MMFKTITDETTLSGQRIVGALQARKIAQQQATAQLEIDIAYLKEYQVAYQNGTVTTEQFDTIMHKASASAVEYSAKIKAGTGTAQSYANAQRATNSALNEVSIGAGIASKAVKLFSLALNMIAFTAITQGISWFIGKVDEWIVTAKEANESANAFKESLSTFFNETQSNLKTISSLSDRFDELSKNVDDNGKKISGTEEEYAEFLDICQQVGQIMPELITGYTAEGEAIITLQGKVDSLADSYREAIKAKASLFISKGDEEGNTIDSFFKDYNNFINGTHVKWFSFSPSPQFSKTSSYEKYYGYNKIYQWLSNVKDKSLEELNNQIKSTSGQIQNAYLRKVLEEADFDINNITEENFNAIHDVINNKFTVMEKELSDRVLNIRSAFQNMLYADDESVQNYTDRINSALQEIQSYCDNNGIVIPIEVNNSVDTLVNNVKSKLQNEFNDRVGELTLDELQIAAEQIEVSEGDLLSWDELIAKIEEVKASKKFFRAFLDTDFGTRIQHITDLFDKGTISHKEYFDALQSEINNFDASNFTNSIEDANKAAAQFYVDSVQHTANGLSTLINSFDSGKISISEYLVEQKINN